MSTFGIHLHGNPDEIAAEALPLISASLLRLMEKAAKSVLTEPVGNLWVIESLNLASIETAIKPRARFLDDGTHVIQVLSAGVELLSARRETPSGWDISMLKEVLHLDKLATRLQGAESLDLVTNGSSPFPMNATFRANLNAAIAEMPVTMGSVSGKIVAWRDKGGADELTVLDELTNDRVKVLVSAGEGLSIEKQARSRVCIWGELTRDHRGAKVRIDKEGFDLLPDKITVPHKSILGLFTDDSGESIDSVKFQRRLRDGD